MQRFDLGVGTDFGVRCAGGLPAQFVNTLLDFRTFISADNHPAIVPLQQVVSTTTLSGAQMVGTPQPPVAGAPTFSTSSGFGHATPAWQAIGPYAATAQPGDTVSWTAADLQVVLTLSGIIAAGTELANPSLAAGAIRNGAQATILIDGAPYASYNLLGQQETITLWFTDGASHTIAVTHAGIYDGAIHPIGPVQAGVGTSMAAALQVRAIAAHPAFITATWRVQATAATTFDLYQQLPGSSSWTKINTNALAVGTTYSDSPTVPGVTLLIPGGTTLATGDTALFTTDVTMIAVSGVSLGLGNGSQGGSTLTTPVFDLGGPAASPVVLEWEETPPLLGVSAIAQVTVQSGPSPVPDGTWTAATPVPITIYRTEDGVTHGLAGLMALAPAQYLRATLHFATGANASPWIRDPRLYAWDPTRAAVVRRISLGDGATFGPALLSYLGTHALFVTDLHQAVLDLDAGRAVTTATDAYLAAALDEVGLELVTGEPPGASRVRAQSILSSEGLTLPGICTQLSALVLGESGTPQLAWAGSGYGASGRAPDNTTPNGVSVVTTGATAYTVTIPPPTAGGSYAGLPGVALGTITNPAPGTARHSITDHVTTALRPVCTTLTLVFAGES